MAVVVSHAKLRAFLGEAGGHCGSKLCSVEPNEKPESRGCYIL